jgi:hypothetical protein
MIKGGITTMRWKECFLVRRIMSLSIDTVM